MDLWAFCIYVHILKVGISNDRFGSVCRKRLIIDCMHSFDVTSKSTRKFFLVCIVFRSNPPFSRYGLVIVATAIRLVSLLIQNQMTTTKNINYLQPILSSQCWKIGWMVWKVYCLSCNGRNVQLNYWWKHQWISTLNNIVCLQRSVFWPLSFCSSPPIFLPMPRDWSMSFFSDELLLFGFLHVPGLSLALDVNYLSVISLN